MVDTIIQIENDGIRQQGYCCRSYRYWYDYAEFGKPVMVILLRI